MLGAPNTIPANGSVTFAILIINFIDKVNSNGSHIEGRALADVRLAHEGYYITYEKFPEFWNTQQFKSLEDKEKIKLVAAALVYLEHLGFPKQNILVADTAKVFLKKEYKDRKKRGILNDIKYERLIMNLICE